MPKCVAPTPEPQELKAFDKQIRIVGRQIRTLPVANSEKVRLFCQQLEAILRRREAWMRHEHEMSRDQG